MYSTYPRLIPYSLYIAHGTIADYLACFDECLALSASCATPTTTADHPAESVYRIHGPTSRSGSVLLHYGAAIEYVQTTLGLEAAGFGVDEVLDYCDARYTLQRLAIDISEFIVDICTTVAVAAGPACRETDHL